MIAFACFQLLLCLLRGLDARSWVGELPVEDELVIYTYDQFLAPGALGREIFPLFEKKNHCHIRALASGNGGQILTRLQLDAKRGKSVAQLIVGIDQSSWEIAQPWTESWGRWLPLGYSRLIKEAQVERGFLPFDYGPLSMIADREVLSQMNLKTPSRLSDLLGSEWNRNIILQDPRTSTPGLSFFLYTYFVLGEGTWSFWKQFRNQWLTMAPGWEGAYGLFLKKEAPLVWSYLTSQAYHEEQGEQWRGQNRYQAVLFQEGQPFQLEGVAWVKGAIKTQRHRELAQKFLEFMISLEVQNRIPNKMWMYPVRKDVELPASFRNLPKPAKMISFQSGLTLGRVKRGKEIETALSRWRQVIGQ